MSVDKKIHINVIKEINIRIIDFRFSFAQSAMFFKTIVIVGNWTFWKLLAISKIHGRTKANSAMIATIVMTINIVG